MSGRPAVFLDRDGTILVERNYLADPDDAELLPGAAQGMRRLRDAGYALVVVTNQSGIARGLYGEADYRRVDERMRALLREHGVEIEGSHHCPHHPDYTGVCDCRKPAPGMLLRAIAELGLDGGRSWLIGDRLRDVEAASALRARGILVLTGYGAQERTSAVALGVPVAADLDAAATHILERPADVPTA